MFACVYIPDFPVEAIVRAEPLLRERPMGVLEGNPPLVRVIALNEKARQLGMETGMTKLQATVFADIPATETPINKEQPPSAARQKNPGNLAAKQLSASAVLHQRSLAQEEAAHAALLDVAHAFTPRVEDTAPDSLLLDLAGMERLYGEPARMARNLASQISVVGIEANVALAANPDTAMHAARGYSGVTVIPAGQEAQRLAMLPLHVLLDSFDISPQKKTAAYAPEREQEKFRQQLFDTLESWGIRDFRSLALLPEHALASRLGETGARLQRLARGAEQRTLALCDPASHFEETMELECSVETIEPLSFVLNRLLEQLCARLEARALAVQELRLRLQLEKRVADEETTTLQELTLTSHNVAQTTYECILRLPVSMRDSKVFLKLLQLELAAHPPGAPITRIWITAEPAPPRSAQRGLFLPITPEAEKLEITLARIKGIVGERQAGIAHLLDTHRRDGFELKRFAVPKEGQSSTTLSDNDGLRSPALRIFRPPRRVRVRLSEGCPASLTEDTSPEQNGGLRGKIIWSSGPWRSSGDWWTENAKKAECGQRQTGPWDREEWDIAISPPSNSVPQINGTMALYRIYRDLATGHWFADANYD